MDPIPSEDMTVHPRILFGTPGDEVLPRNAAMDESGDRKLPTSPIRLSQQLKVVFYIYILYLYAYECFCFDGVSTCSASFSTSFFYV